MASAQDEEFAKLQKALLFIQGVSTYQGYFDSVENYCKPHAKEIVVRQTRYLWDQTNNGAVKLRDSEMERVVEEAIANDMPQDKLEKLKNWSNKYYQVSVESDKFYKDLPDKFNGDLNLACAQRLGVMVSAGMKLERLNPDAWQYFQDHSGSAAQ